MRWTLSLLKLATSDPITLGIRFQPEFFIHTTTSPPEHQPIFCREMHCFLLRRNRAFRVSSPVNK